MIPVEKLLDQIQSGEFPFPYNRTLTKKSKKELFHGIQSFCIERSTDKYFLKSYYPSNVKSFPNLTYKGKYLSFVSNNESYWNADVLSDFYNEEVRMRAKREDQDKSIEECWKDRECMRPIVEDTLKSSFSDTIPFFLRNRIFRHRPEVKIFNPTWGVALIKEVRGKNLQGQKWLDISSGWGDRLLIAMALGIDYTGFDLNSDLQKGHSEMIQDFGDSLKHRVFYQPFERAELQPNTYDFCFTSTPYFKLELYTNLPGQSVDSFSTFDSRMDNFLFASLKKAWDALKSGGHLMLHLDDTKEYKMAEPANLYIQSFPDAIWEGVIGLACSNAYRRPVWIWKKK